MTAALYLRFSPRPNAEEARSLEVQEDRCRAYCTSFGLNVAHVIRDPETSARTVPLDERDGGKELLRLVKVGEVKHIVVAKLDRLFRSLDGRPIMEAWYRRGITLHIADQGGNSLAMNLGSAVGRMLVSQLLLFAELEPAITAERTSAAMKYRQANGQAMSSKPPYGLQEGPQIDDKRTWIDCPEEQEVIGRVRLMRSAKLGYREIAGLLDKAGVPCRGKQWHPETIKRMLRRSAV